MLTKYFLTPFFCSFIISTTNLSALDCCSIFYDDKPIKKEISQIKSRLDTLEGQLNANMAQVAELKFENTALKNQLAAHQEESNGKFDAQEGRLDSTEELGKVLTKYGSNPDGMTILHYAIKMGDANTVKLLLANGSDVNSISFNYWCNINFTALAWAAYCNQLEVAQLLLSHGADVNLTASPDLAHKSAIDYASQFGSGELVSLLIEYGAKLDTIFSDPRFIKSTHITPLHSACLVGNYDAVVALVNGGANINGNDTIPAGTNHWNQGTPLDYAANNLKCSENPKNLQLIKFLVKNGAIRRMSFNSVQCPVIQSYLKYVGR